MSKEQSATDGELLKIASDIAGGWCPCDEYSAPDDVQKVAHAYLAMRSALSETPRSDEPTGWAVFASDTHEMVDLTLIKPDEAEGYYAEPVYTRSAIQQKPVELTADPEREGCEGLTGILVRAKDSSGKWGSLDIAELDRASLHAWLRSRGGKNLYAENCVLALLGWEQLPEGS